MYVCICIYIYIYTHGQGFQGYGLRILRIRYLVPRILVCAVFSCLAILRIEGCLKQCPLTVFLESRRRTALRLRTAAFRGLAASCAMQRRPTRLLTVRCRCLCLMSRLFEATKRLTPIVFHIWTRLPIYTYIYIYIHTHKKQYIYIYIYIYTVCRRLRRLASLLHRAHGAGGLRAWRAQALFDCRLDCVYVLLFLLCYWFVVVVFCLLLRRRRNLA